LCNTYQSRLGIGRRCMDNFQNSPNFYINFCTNWWLWTANIYIKPAGHVILRQLKLGNSDSTAIAAANSWLLRTSWLGFSCCPLQTLLTLHFAAPLENIHVSSVNLNFCAIDFTDYSVAVGSARAEAWYVIQCTSCSNRFLAPPKLCSFCTVQTTVNCNNANLNLRWMHTDFALLGVEYRTCLCLWFPEFWFFFSILFF